MKLLIRVGIVVAAVILVAAGVIAYGVFLYRYDNSPELSRMILSNEHGGLSEAGISAALNASYPAGARSDTILASIERYDGARCGCRSGECSCTMAWAGSFCTSTMLTIDFQEGIISSPIKARIWGDGC